MDAARAALAAARETGAHVVAKDAYGRLLAPVTGMDKVICIGMNYKDHCEEMGAPLPEEPRVFCKFPSCVSAGGDPIPLSEGGVRTEQLDVEVEMAVVIGRECLNVAVEDARAYVAGYTVANDLSARDHQFNRCGRNIAIGRRIAIAAEGIVALLDPSASYCATLPAIASLSYRAALLCHFLCSDARYTPHDTTLQRQPVADWQGGSWLLPARAGHRH